MAKKRARETQQEMFGGQWTQQKLECLQKYLRAYTKILKGNVRARKFLQITYVDAFAGSGYMPQEIPEMPLAQVLPEIADIRAELEKQAEEYKKGSAVRALEVEPAFDRYLFIERDPALCIELEHLRDQFPSKRDRIFVVKANANEYLLNWCSQTDWRKNRAVVFLDPFGMQVEWSLIKAIAGTKAIDLWLLFPLFAVNRMLVTRGKPPSSWSSRLTRSFGTEQWENEFYQPETSTFFEQETEFEKVADESRISKFLVKRLESVFARVAEPLVLRNRRGATLFLFCFAAGNPSKAELAVKIAKDIVGG